MRVDESFDDRTQRQKDILFSVLSPVSVSLGFIFAGVGVRKCRKKVQLRFFFTVV